MESKKKLKQGGGSQKQMPLSKQMPVMPQIINSSQNPAFEKNKQDRVKLIAGIVFVGFIASLLYHYYQAHILDKDYYPYNTFLFSPIDRFNDFLNIYPFSSHLDPYGFVGVYGLRANYFPLMYLMIFFFNVFNPETALFFFLATFIIFFIVYVYRSIPLNKGIYKNLITFVLVFMSYPFLFVVDRANLEVWLFMSLVMFIYYYIKGKNFLSILFLSIAISLKLFPAIFFLLFFIDREYMKIVYAGIMTVLLSVISMAIFKGGVIVNAKGLLFGLSKFNSSYILSSASATIQYNISIWAPLKLLYYDILIQKTVMPLHYEQTFNKYYVIFTFCFFAFLAIIMMRYKMSLWKKVTLLLLTSIVLQQLSFDYKLINIFIPLMLYLNANEESKFNIVYTFIFGLLLIPKDYIIVANYVSIAVIINPILIMTMIIMILFEAIRDNNQISLSYYFTFINKKMYE